MSFIADINYIFSFFCHQLVERSPHFEGDIFPVCYRCAGIYLGMFSTYSVMFFSKRFLKPLTSKNEIFLISLLFFPLIVDGLGNTLNLWHSAPLIRSITGLFAGIFLAAVLIPFLKFNKGKNNFVEHFKVSYFTYPFVYGFLLIVLLLFPVNKFIFKALTYLVVFGLILILINIFLLWKYYNPTVVNNDI